LARPRAFCKAGKSIDAKMAIIAITTKSSINVKKTGYFFIIYNLDFGVKN
jgi:hypothetical protein